jgi:hypothetical protein
MFARKLERAEGLKDSAAAGIADLRSGAGTVNAAYSALNEVYEEARDSRMAPIYDAYRDAILRATSILDEFDRWKGGLFITSENVNLLPKIAERAVEIEEELIRASNLGFEAKTAALLADIQRIVGGEAENRGTIAELCRVYFCELTSRRSMAATIRACRRPSLASNPICVDQDGGLRGGVLTADFQGPQPVEIGELCRAAGLDPAFTVIGMAPATAASCLEEMP